MKIGIYADKSADYDIINVIKERLPEALIHIFSKDRETKQKPDKNIIYHDEINRLIEEKDIVFNIISAKEINPEKYIFLSAKYNIDFLKAESLIKLISAFELLPRLELFASEVAREKTNKGLLINTSGPVDIITLYLYKKFGVESYGISRKAGSAVEYLLGSLNLDNYRDKVNYNMAGINNSLWLYEISDNKGDDIYPEIRGRVKDLDLNIKRNELTRDSLKSLNFYGYFHSYNVLPENDTKVIGDFFDAFFHEKKTIYFNAVNHGTIYELDSGACAELPFHFINGNLLRAEVELPLQCTLAMTDMASATALAVKTLITLNRDDFMRTVKLEPYLASILTLGELQGIADDILAIEPSVKARLETGDIL